MALIDSETFVSIFKDISKQIACLWGVQQQPESSLSKYDFLDLISDQCQK